MYFWGGLMRPLRLHPIKAATEVLNHDHGFDQYGAQPRSATLNHAAYKLGLAVVVGKICWWKFIHFVSVLITENICGIFLQGYWLSTCKFHGHTTVENSHIINFSPF